MRRRKWIALGLAAAIGLALGALEAAIDRRLTRGERLAACAGRQARGCGAEWIAPITGRTGR